MPCAWGNVGVSPEKRLVLVLPLLPQFPALTCFITRCDGTCETACLLWVLPLQQNVGDEAHKSPKLQSLVRSPRKAFGRRWTSHRSGRGVCIFWCCQIMRATEGVRIQKIGNKEQRDSNNKSFLERFLMVASWYLCSWLSNVLFQPLQGGSLVSCVWVLSTPVVIQVWHFLTNTGTEWYGACQLAWNTLTVNLG